MRWLAPAALLALAPKCVLCLAAYAGLGTALGLGGRELCGGQTAGTVPGWIASLAIAGMVGFAGVLAMRHRRRSRERGVPRQHPV